MDFDLKPLDDTTWTAFVQLVQRHKGVWGGCWCMGFHRRLDKTTASENRSDKERLVLEGRAHAILVYDGDSCVGWCQFGTYPEDFNGRAVSKSLPYMYNGLISMFETLGFERICTLGKNHWLVRKVIGVGASSQHS